MLCAAHSLLRASTGGWLKCLFEAGARATLGSAVLCAQGPGLHRCWRQRSSKKGQHQGAHKSVSVALQEPFRAVLGLQGPISLQEEISAL